VKQARVLLSLVVLAVIAGCGDAGNTQLLPIGSRCSRDSDCGTQPYTCRTNGYRGGYCEKPCSTDGDCPADSWCQPPLGCRRSCQTNQDACRTAEGYVCILVPMRAYCDVAAPAP
jgi:hypothetical protein